MGSGFKIQGLGIGLRVTAATSSVTRAIPSLECRLNTCFGFRVSDFGCERYRFHERSVSLVRVIQRHSLVLGAVCMMRVAGFQKNNDNYDNRYIIK